MSLKHSLILILTALITFSCSLERRCMKMRLKCPITSKIIIKDSVITKTTTLYNDTIIYKTLHLYSDTTITDTIINGYTSQDTLTINGNISDAFAWVRYNKLNLRLHEKDTLLLIKLDSALKEIKIEKNNYKIITEIKEPIIITNNSSFAHFCIWGFWILFFINILLFILKRDKLF